MEKKVVNHIKMLGIDMIDRGESGHPGIVLSAAPIIYSIYANHLRLNLSHQSSDRFVLSAGHGSALLYATLHMFGFPISIDDLKQFRNKGSITPGHPENFMTPGVEMTTGPLGQGIAGAVGLAIGDRYLQKNNFVYVLCSDGDLMEGISYESLSLAGNLKLNNLIIIYDSNDVTLDGWLEKSFFEDIKKRFEAIGFDYYKVTDGNDLHTLNYVIELSKKSDKPVLIEVKTIIGQDSFWQGSNEVHGKPLLKEDIVNLRKILNIKEAFYVPDEIRNYAIGKIDSRRFVDEKIRFEPINMNMKFDDLYQSDEELRISGAKVLKRIMENNKMIIGGSADLGSSTKTYFPEFLDFGKNNYLGRNIWYGVREHAMGQITNGISLTGLRPYASTFLVFADYMKPAIRLAAIMKTNSIFIFTHDSINIGPDGPTHQPVEQLAMLRSIPNLNVFRPADIKETEGSFKIAFTSNGPSAIVLSRNRVRKQVNTRVKMVEKGAYIVRKEKNLHGIIIATGSEVGVAMQIAKELYREKKIDLRVVSMPCRELFETQTEKYQLKVLPKGIKKIVIEAASSFGWEGYVYHKKYLITVNHFGISAKTKDVLEHFDYTFEEIKKRILKLI